MYKTTHKRHTYYDHNEKFDIFLAYIVLRTEIKLYCLSSHYHSYKTLVLYLCTTDYFNWWSCAANIY